MVFCSHQNTPIWIEISFAIKRTFVVVKCTKSSIWAASTNLVRTFLKMFAAFPVSFFPIDKFEFFAVFFWIKQNDQNNESQLIDKKFLSLFCRPTGIILSAAYIHTYKRLVSITAFCFANKDLYVAKNKYIAFAKAKYQYISRGTFRRTKVFRKILERLQTSVRYVFSYWIR